MKKNVSCVGTIRNNRVELPREFAEVGRRELFSSLVGYNTSSDGVLVSYKCKKNKVVNMLSTMHTSKMNFDSSVKRLPEVISFYNKTKGGVDCADQMIETFSSKFCTRRWPVVLFCNLIDMAALNGYVLFNQLQPAGTQPMKRRLYTAWQGSLRSAEESGSGQEASEQ